MAIPARDSRENMDERYDVWLDKESTGLVQLERFLAQSANERVAENEQSRFHRTIESPLKLQIMSSLDHELLKEGWWASNGMTLCATMSKVSLTLMYQPMYRLNLVADHAPLRIELLRKDRQL